MDRCGEARLVRYLCPGCSRIVPIDRGLDEVLSSSSAGSWRASAGARRKTVLVVDDAAAALAEAEQLLSAAGFDVLRAGDGIEALRVIRASHPDLVVLDLLLPRMTGFEVLREMERDERLKTIPVVATSGVGREDSLEFMRTLGARGFVDKQRLVERLVPAARQLLGGAAPSS